MIGFMLYRGGFELAFLHVGHGVRRDGPGRIAIVRHDDSVAFRARVGDLLIRLPASWRDGERYLRLHIWPSSRPSGDGVAWVLMWLLTSAYAIAEVLPGGLESPVGAAVALPALAIGWYAALAHTVVTVTQPESKTA